MTVQRSASARRALRAAQAPDETGAQARAWDVVCSAYADRAPAARRISRRPLALVATVVVLSGALALALSPAGASVSRWIRHALGIPHAANALFSLPARGRVLVSGAGGTWTVAADGAARRLGPWRQASWSPRGKYVVVAGDNQLVAVDPRGTPRWSLARPAVSHATWYPPTGWRIAYLSKHDLRVVAGDGTGDRLLAAGVAAVAPAWRPGHPYQLSYQDVGRRVVLQDADSGALLWAAGLRVRARQLQWSADGKHLLVVNRLLALLYSPSGRVTSIVATTPDSPIITATLSPNGRTLALVRGGLDSGVAVADVGSRHPRLRPVLPGEGIAQLSWSPDGRWLLAGWPSADQWVFVHVVGRPRLAAVSRIAKQFAAGPRASGFPRIEGWCCTVSGSAG
jgi:hypothetical protein